MIKFGIGKKEPEKPPILGKGFIPTEKVKDLSKKGFSEPEIIDILRKEGFSAEEIDRALTQTLKIGVTGEEQELPTLDNLNQAKQNIFYPQEIQQTITQPQQFQSDYYPQEFINEEIIESIVHEKMSDLDEKLLEFKNKYNELERKILDLHNQLSVISKGGKERESEMLSKIESLREGVEEISARLSSLEKTFKETLPSLIESVRALTDLVHEFRRKN